MSTREVDYLLLYREAVQPFVGVLHFLLKSFLIHSHLVRLLRAR